MCVVLLWKNRVKVHTSVSKCNIWICAYPCFEIYHTKKGITKNLNVDVDLTVDSTADSSFFASMINNESSMVTNDTAINDTLN